MGKGVFRRRNIGLLIKVVIALLAFWFVYREVKVKNQQAGLAFGVDLLLSPQQLPYLTVLMLMMLSNWILEATKWRLLISRIERISLSRSLKAIFSGITIAVFTPNRIGEYGGRVFHLQKADRIDATLLTIVGSYAQLVVTLITGMLASLFFIPEHVGLGPLSPLQFRLIAMLVIVFCGFLIALFLNTRLLTNVFNRLPVPKRYHHYAGVFKYHSTEDLWKVLVLSASRYFIFTMQFFLLLRVFGVGMTYAQAMMMISMTYFVMTAIPTFAITELGVRGSVGIYFLGMLSANETGIFAASSMLWLINLAIPALIGAVFIFDLRFFRKNR